MYQTVTKSAFHDAFASAGRKDNFSYDALNALFEYLEAMEDSMGEMGESIELDVIGICCGFTEDTTQNIAEQYDVEIDEDTPEEDKGEVLVEAVRQSLEDEGTYIAGPFRNGCFLYAG